MSNRSERSWISGVLWLPFLCIVSTNASAADIEVLSNDASSVTLIFITGEIASGDSDIFLDAISGIESDTAIVFLDSPGGNLRESLQIGAEVRLRGISTGISKGKNCYSGCALIWVAGSNRYISADSIIGFHAAYRFDDGVAVESGMGNAEVGSYLTHLGLNIDAIRFATIAGPADARILTPEIAQALGIDIVLLDDSGDSLKKPPPSGGDFARIFSRIGMWESLCTGFFGPMSNSLLRERSEAFNSGNAVLGSDMWVEYMLQEMELIKYEIETVGNLIACLNTGDVLLELEVSVGIFSPSFECRDATTPTEQTICGTPDLWADDQIMNEIYLIYRDAPKSKDRLRYFTEQRAWLKLRDSCGSNAQCIRETYLLRLKVLSNLFVGK